MKKHLFFFILLITQLSIAQRFTLKVEGNSVLESKAIDSIGYQEKHETVNSLLETKKLFEKKIINNGFLENQLLAEKKINDSLFVLKYQLGNRTKDIHIYIGSISAEKKQLLALENDTLKFPVGEIENWMLQKTQLLEANGYALAKLKLTDQNTRKNILYSTLTIHLNTKRTINDIVILGYDKFPKNIKHNWKRKLKNRTFNQKLVDEIYADFNQFPFVTQTKYPEILFTEEATKVYTYVEKARPNKFDGFIGFANDENNKLVFNGYLDLNLQNILNGGEKFNLFWKNDGKQQTSFNLGTEIPYIFKSPLGIKANLNIFKQDSTFQNTKSEFNLGYYLTYNQKIYLGIQSTTSIDIQNANSISLNNYKNRFYNISYEYSKRNNSNYLFPEKTNFSLKFGLGNRTITGVKTNQFYNLLSLSHNFYLNPKNTISLQNQTFYLDSQNYIINELHRFGGTNSIRGFRENSLQANFFAGIFLEYKYQLASNLYIHSISDFGYFQDKTNNLQDKLLGLGFGFGLLTKNGLFNLAYANGSTEKQPARLSNSIVHISFKTIF